jgi:pyrroline-5-carboxylate reductase
MTATSGNHGSEPTRVGKLGLVGGGKMGQALLRGLLSAGLVREEDVNVVEPHEATADWWRENHPGCNLSDLSSALKGAQVVILAVKPDMVSQVASQGADRWGGKLILSVAAGTKLAKLTQWFGTDRVIRTMPNTPALVGQGAAAFCCAAGTKPEDQRLANQILSAVGIAIEVSEKQLDAVTGLSGSGPAYVCMLIEALADGGVAAGLPRETSMLLATQTVLGTAQMVKETGQHPAALKDAVASPGGTTIAGIRALEQNGFRSALIEAVAAAAGRAAELG